MVLFVLFCWFGIECCLCLGLLVVWGGCLLLLVVIVFVIGLFVCLGFVGWLRVGVVVIWLWFVCCLFWFNCYLDLLDVGDFVLLVGVGLDVGVCGLYVGGRVVTLCIMRYYICCFVFLFGVVVSGWVLDGW